MVWSEECIDQSSAFFYQLIKPITHDCSCKWYEAWYVWINPEPHTPIPLFLNMVFFVDLPFSPIILTPACFMSFIQSYAFGVENSHLLTVT